MLSRPHIQDKSAVDAIIFNKKIPLNFIKLAIVVEQPIQKYTKHILFVKYEASS